jgi:hypothetical protein
VRVPNGHFDLALQLEGHCGKECCANAVLILPGIRHPQKGAVPCAPNDGYFAACLSADSSDSWNPSTVMDACETISI